MKFWKPITTELPFTTETVGSMYVAFLAGKANGMTGLLGATALVCQAV